MVSFYPSQEQESAELQNLVCAHCGSSISNGADHNRTSPLFCCNGCRTVYSLINSVGLDRYYELRTTAKPIFIKNESYAYLDDSEFKKKFMHGAQGQIEFYLEGIHCAACMWLIEKLPVFVSGVKNARLDFGRAVVHVEYEPHAKLSQIADTLNQLGYRPHPIEKNEHAEKLQKKENRSWLIRIGVAGACTGNSMLMTIPLYSGVSGSLVPVFRFSSFALFLPILFYGAVPFYKSAFTSIKSKMLSIDIPIVLALFMGTAVSLANLGTPNKHIYFDSLSALVFLLLASRYALRRMQQNALQTSHLFQFLAPSAAKRWNVATQSAVEVSASSLKAGDYIQVETHQVIPVDGIVRSGNGYVNFALLTGESQPQKVSVGSEVFAGTVNEGPMFLIETAKTGENTRLGKILKQTEDGISQKPKIVTLADKLAKWFLGAVILGAAITVVANPSLTEGFNRALALVIITCPCALALATPLTMRMAMSKAAKIGALIKSSEALEKLARVKNLIIDKTGTLTFGNLQVLEWEEKIPGVDAKTVTCALESLSQHPLAKALLEYLMPDAKLPLPTVSDFKEIHGQGVSGIVNGRIYSIRPLRSSENTAVAIYREDSLIAQAKFGDRLREDSTSLANELKKRKLDLFILSGDNKTAVKAVSRKLEVQENNAIGEASPEFKREFVLSHPMSFMVGDGANDAPALSAAYVSASMHGSVEISLRSSDIFLTRDGIAPVIQLIKISRRAMHTIYMNFFFSLAYNAVGAMAAITGHVSPLFAAVLMPLSAFTVFAVSLFAFNPLFRKELE